MQVQSMDERFRYDVATQGSEQYLFEANNGVQVKSGAFPFLDLTAISPEIRLFGWESGADNKVSVSEFSSNESRDAALALAVAALEDWAANWPGFENEPSNPTVSTDGDVVTVEV
jgi:hypothetical protein